VFSGRARKKEYWTFFIFNLIITFVLEFIEGSDVNLLTNIYELAVFIPSIAVGVRRMHDINKSGWYLLIPIYNLILTLTDGTKGDNKYGPDPKEIKVS